AVGPGRGDLVRVLLERQGVRLCAARHRGRVDRRRARRRGGLAVSHHALWLSLPAAGVEQAVPALRRRARRYFHRRSRGVRAARASRGKPGRECGTAARGRRIERRAPHVRPASARPWCTRRHAALAPQDIEYINFHGTGTPSNDDAEARAVTNVLGNETPGSSTKGATGHTLGAAGALEAVICALALQHGVMPAGVNTTELDPALTVHYLRDNRVTRLSRVMSNSFGFGGSNCSLIFGRAG